MDPSARRRGRPGNDVDIVGQSFGVDCPANLNNVVAVEAVFGELVGADAHAEHSVAADLFAQPQQDLPQAAAGGCRKLPPNSSSRRVGSGIEKLRYQVAHAGQHFDPVQTGIGQAPARLPVGLNDLPNHCGGHGARHHTVALIRAVGRGIGHGPAAVMGHAHRAAGMKQLPDNPAAVAPAGPCQFGEPRYDGIVAGIEKRIAGKP